MGESTFTAKLLSTGTEKVHAITLGGHQSTTACPPTMLKDHPGSTSPHHLFLASIGSCINLVFEIALRSAHIDVSDIQSDIKGIYETDEKNSNEPIYNNRNPDNSYCAKRRERGTH